jgi:hypothetical protein
MVVLTGTNFVHDTIMTQQGVTHKNRDLSSSGNLAMPQAARRRLSPPRLGLDPSPVRVGSVARKVALRHDFSKQVYLGFILRVSFHQCSVFKFRASAIKSV